jgi:hypothetical protein
MRRTSRTWTNEDCEKLTELVRSGASPYRAAVALNRTVTPIRKKARELGCPFPYLRDIKNKSRELKKQ